MDLDTIRYKKARFVVGLMSGTSSDGVDAVLMRLQGEMPRLSMKLIGYQNFPFSAELRKQLLNEHMNARDVCLLNFKMGEILSDAAETMIRDAFNRQIKVDFIASHGHTVAHCPPSGNAPFGTLQIGEPAMIAERTGVPVVSDFRPRDMCAGGQGAPLVPYADWLIFHRDSHTVGCLNLGGIANFTILPPNFSDVMAFDTGPANMATDGAIRLLSRGEMEYDKDGAVAAKGKVIPEFLDYLLDHPYFKKPPPKTTGRDEFGAHIYLRDALLNRRDHSMEDLMATVTHSVARNIMDAYKNFISQTHNIQFLVVGGGGARNKTLMGMLQAAMPNVTIYTSERYGIPLGAREALSFAILGHETIMGRPSNIPNATGASHPCVLGKITPP